MLYILSGWTPDYTTLPRTGRGFCKNNKSGRVSDFLDTRLFGHSGSATATAVVAQTDSLTFMSNSLIIAKFRRNSCMNITESKT